MTAIDKTIEEVKKYRDICAEEYKFPFKLCIGILERAKKLEDEQFKQEFIAGYNIGYIDAQCNHINDGENLANEREYLKESTCEYSGLRSVQSYEDPKK
jgi:hypothetical protein